jgi:hypothetical protein
MAKNISKPPTTYTQAYRVWQNILTTLPAKLTTRYGKNLVEKLAAFGKQKIKTHQQNRLVMSIK